GGTRVVAIGHDEVLPMYLDVGLELTGQCTRSGALTYHLLHDSVPRLSARIAGMKSMVDRMEREIAWDLPVPFACAQPCFHGGAFFQAIGDGFDSLERKETVINA